MFFSNIIHKHFPISCVKMVIVFLAVANIVPAATQGSFKAQVKLQTGDKLRYHKEVIKEGDASYTVKFNGTVDGVMTRDPVGYQAYTQGFQPNLSVRIENRGETDVVNPWITVNGKRNWRTVKDIVAEATKGYTTDREKALAIWNFQHNNRFHATTSDDEVKDPVKMFNVYGYTLCGDDSHVLADLMRTAGLKTRAGYPMGHSTTEVFFDGSYHLLDGDEGIICLKRDNKTIASELDIVRDHDLLKRTHTYGILAKENRKKDEFSASLHWYKGIRSH